MKIRNQKELEAEKQRLRQRNEELEKLIKYDLRDCKDSLKIKNILGGSLSGTFKPGADFVSHEFSRMASKVLKRASAKLRNTVAGWFTK